MGPELSTAAAGQNFAWICKQHQDLIGDRFGTNFQDPEFGLVWRKSCLKHFFLHDNVDI